MSFMWISHIPHVNESCHTCKWVMSYKRVRHVPHMKESRHTYECVMKEACTSCVEGTHTHSDSLSHIHAHFLSLTHTHTHTHTHAHTHTHTHTRTRTHTQPQRHVGGGVETRKHVAARDWDVETHSKMNTRHVLQYIVAFCSVLQCVAVSYSELRWVTVSFSELQWVALCCLQDLSFCRSGGEGSETLLQCAAERFSVLQCAVQGGEDP